MELAFGMILIIFGVVLSISIIASLIADAMLTKLSRREYEQFKKDFVCDTCEDDLGCASQKGRRVVRRKQNKRNPNDTNGRRRRVGSRSRNR